MEKRGVLDNECEEPVSEENTKEANEQNTKCCKNKSCGSDTMSKMADSVKDKLEKKKPV